MPRNTPIPLTELQESPSDEPTEDSERTGGQSEGATPSQPRVRTQRSPITLESIQRDAERIQRRSTDTGTRAYQFGARGLMSTVTSTLNAALVHGPQYRATQLLRSVGAISEREFQHVKDDLWQSHTERLPKGLELMGEGWQDVAEWTAEKAVSEMPWYLKSPLTPPTMAASHAQEIAKEVLGEKGTKEAVHQFTRRVPEIGSALLGLPGLVETKHVVPYKETETVGGTVGAMVGESAEYFAALASINKATSFAGGARSSSRLVNASIRVADLAKSSIVAGAISEAQQTQFDPERFRNNTAAYFAIIGGSQLFRGVVAPRLKALAQGGKLANFLQSKTLDGSVAKTLQQGGRAADYLLVQRADDWIESVSETAYWAGTQRPKGETFMGAFAKALPSALVVNYFQESIGDLPLLNSGGPMGLFSRESSVSPSNAMKEQQWIETIRSDVERTRMAIDDGMRLNESEQKAFEQYERLVTAKGVHSTLRGMTKSEFESMWNNWVDMGLDDVMNRADTLVLDRYRTSKDIKDRVREIDNQLFKGEMTQEEARKAYEDVGIEPPVYDKFADVWLMNKEPLLPVKASDPRHGRQPLVPNQSQMERKQEWESAIEDIPAQIRGGEQEAGLQMAEDAIDSIDADVENRELTPVQARSLKRRINTLSGVETEVAPGEQAQQEAGVEVEPAQEAEGGVRERVVDKDTGERPEPIEETANRINEVVENRAIVDTAQGARVIVQNDPARENVGIEELQQAFPELEWGIQTGGDSPTYYGVRKELNAIFEHAAELAVERGEGGARPSRDDVEAEIGIDLTENEWQTWLDTYEETAPIEAQVRRIAEVQDGSREATMKDIEHMEYQDFAESPESLQRSVMEQYYAAQGNREMETRMATGREIDRTDRQEAFRWFKENGPERMQTSDRAARRSELEDMKWMDLRQLAKELNVDLSPGRTADEIIPDILNAEADYAPEIVVQGDNAYRQWGTDGIAAVLMNSSDQELDDFARWLADQDHPLSDEVDDVNTQRLFTQYMMGRVLHSVEGASPGAEIAQRGQEGLMGELVEMVEDLDEGEELNPTEVKKTAGKYTQKEVEEAYAASYPNADDNVNRAAETLADLVKQRGHYSQDADEVRRPDPPPNATADSVPWTIDDKRREYDHVEGHESQTHWAEDPIPIRYEVWESEALETSHNPHGHENDVFPQEYQNRIDYHKERHEHIASRSNEDPYDPARLGRAATARDGAPTASEELLVVAGNARKNATDIVQDSSDNTYKSWLVEHADDFGVDPADVQSMENPQLVARMLENPDVKTMKDFVEWSNKPGVYELSEAEKAVQDANNIDRDMLAKLTVLANGKPSSSLSNGFTKAWVREVLSPQERGDMLTDDGSHLTPAGKRRMITSILARVYMKWGDDQTVNDARLRMMKRLAGQADPTAPLKTFQLGMIRAAEDVARARQEIEEGVLDDEYDIGDTMIQVLELVRRARDTYEKSGHRDTWTLRTALETELGESNMFGESRELGTAFRPAAKALARAFVGDPVMPNKDETTMGRSEEDARKPMMRSNRKIARVLSRVARRVTSQERGDGLGFETAEDVPPLEDVVQTTVDEITEDTTEQGQVFGFPGGEALQLETGEEPVQAEGPEGPMDRQQIVNALRASLGLKIATGGYQATVWGETREAVYDSFHRVLRMMKAHELSSLTHDVGHDLANWFGMFEQLTPEARSELGRLGQELYPDLAGDELVHEGFGEFSRLWFTKPAVAQERAPKMFALFENMIEEADLGDPLGDIQDMIHEYITQGSMKRIRGIWMPEREGQRRAIEMENALYHDEMKRILLDLETNLFDPHGPIKEFEAQVGPASEISESPKELAKAMSGAKMAALSKLLSSEHGGRGQRDYETWEVVGPTLGDILKPIVDQDSLAEYIDYDIAKHIVNGGDAYETPVSMEDAEVTVRNLESSLFAETHRRHVKWRRQNAQYLEDAGLYPSGMVEMWAKKYPSYAPLNRIMDYVSRVKKSGDGGLKPIKRRGDSTRPIRHTIESDIRMAMSANYAAEVNRFKKSLVDMAAETEGAGKWFEKIPADQVPTTVTMQEAVNALEETGADVDSVPREVLEEAFEVWRPSWFSPPDTITVYRDGQKEYWEVKDRRLLESIEHLTSGEVEIRNKMFRYAGKVTNVFKQGVTLNPLFWAKRNPVRDLFTGFLQHDHGLAYASHFFKGFAEAIGKGEAYGEWLSSGAAMSQLVNLRHADDPNIQVQELVGKNKWKNLLKGDPIPVIPVLQELAAAGENAGRLAAFTAESDYLERVAEEGELEGAEQFNKPINRILAAGRQSQESNVNFSNIGHVTRYANTLKPFFSANMNGMQTLFRNMTGGANVTGGMGEVAPTRSRKAFEFWAKAFGSITMFSLMVYLFNRQIPAYQEISDREKDIYWHIPMGMSENDNQVWFKIPKPFEHGILFGSLPERFLRYVDQRDPTAFDGFAQSLTGTWPGMDLLNIYKGGFYPIQPLSEAHFNESFFWNSPIFPTNLEGKAGFLQDRPSTTEISKTLSRQMERMTGSSFSPAKAEHLLRGYFGSLGIMGLRTLDWSLQGLGVVKEKDGELSGTSEWPMIRPQLRRAGQYAKSVDDFYTEFNESRKAYTSWQEMKANGNFKGAKDYLQRHEENIRRYKRLQSTGSRLRNLREQRMRIYESDMDNEKKREEINDLNHRMVNDARKAIGREPLD